MSFRKFQFHLVRLKVSCLILEKSLTWFQFHLVRLKERVAGIADHVKIVSIPFSTIKSLHRVELYDNTSLFQFHLVRLKVDILSGSLLIVLLFQFHLVRLKVYA